MRLSGITMGSEYQKALAVIEEVERTVTGKKDCVRKAFAAILAGGHILIEDVPGVGKTTLALAFSKAMALINHRVQFTPDVMPADILGFQMYHKETDSFSYYPGSILCNLFLADEINRTSPKTQSALLEVMEEGIVTVDGIERAVPKPFIVMATQNPKGSAGTLALPESQLDRFMICMSMGYPDLKSEVEIVKKRTKRAKNDSISAVISAEELVLLTEKVKEVFVHEHVYDYIATLMRETRDNPYIELGVSTRGTIACTKMAMAWAFLQGRDYVIPEDVIDVFFDVTRHRIVLSAKARVNRVTVADVLDEIAKVVKPPASYMERS